MSAKTHPDVSRPPHPDAERDEKASAPLKPVDVHGFEEARKREKKKKRRRKRKKKLTYGHLPVWLVFWSLLGISVWTLFYSGSIIAGMAACVLIAAAYVVDDQYGFAWSRRSRRSYKVRTNFNKIEIFILGCVLVIILFYVIVYWVYRLAF